MVKSLQKEKEAIEVVLRETQAKLGLLEGFIKDMVQRSGLMEGAITQIVDHIQSQNLFNECVRTTPKGLVEEFRKYQEHFKEVVQLLENHEEHIKRDDVLSDSMAQYIKRAGPGHGKDGLVVEGLMKESEVQALVLRQQEMGGGCITIPPSPNYATFSFNTILAF